MPSDAVGISRVPRPRLVERIRSSLSLGARPGHELVLVIGWMTFRKSKSSEHVGTAHILKNCTAELHQPPTESIDEASEGVAEVGGGGLPMARLASRQRGGA